MTAPITVEEYDPLWAEQFETLRSRIAPALGGLAAAIEHVGSTAVAGLAAKPIIDMMAAVMTPEIGYELAARLEERAYRLIETDMRRRLLLRKHSPIDCCAFHLHIVEYDTWRERHERLMRDYLLRHSDAAAAYAAIKIKLSCDYAEDPLAYTRAKTAFIQELVDKACAERGLSSVRVWND